MKNLPLIDPALEFEKLYAATAKMWTCFDSECVKTALKKVFFKGIIDGENFLSQSPILDISQHIHGNYDLLEVRNDTRYQNSYAMFTDALCLFTMQLSTGFSELQKQPDSLLNLNFDKNVKALISDFKNMITVSQSSIEPKPACGEQQDNFVKEYTGYSVARLGTFETIEMLNFRQAQYGKENQGYSYIHSLVSQFYQHGFSIMEANNNNILINDLAPIYLELENSPLSTENGSEILNQALKNKFVQMIHANKKFN